MSDDIPAFPCSEFRNTSSDPLATPREIKHLGLTLRDWFAGQALAGLLASDAGHGPVYQGAFDFIARASFEFADAMLKARTTLTTAMEGEKA